MAAHQLENATTSSRSRGGCGESGSHRDGSSHGQVVVGDGGGASTASGAAADSSAASPNSRSGMPAVSRRPTAAGTGRRRGLAEGHAVEILKITTVIFISVTWIKVNLGPAPGDDMPGVRRYRKLLPQITAPRHDDDHRNTSLTCNKTLRL